jgi:protein-S-isoprenylcysteine O-methyltransferase Ste14
MNFSFLELRIPPVLVVAATAGLMWAIAWAFPSLNLTLPGRTPAAILAALTGVLITLAGVVEFRRARTTTNPLRPANATSLVEGGIYRMTRNPMYLGFALALLGWGIFLSSPLSLAVLFLFVAYMNRFQIAPEEKALESLFGDEFAAYRSKVRRWL